jgi:hypothetical protein
MELPLEGVSESAESWPLKLPGKVSNVPMALPCSVAVKREEGLGAIAMGAVLGTAAVELVMARKRRGEAKGEKRGSGRDSSAGARFRYRRTATRHTLSYLPISEI